MKAMDAVKESLDYLVSTINTINKDDLSLSLKSSLNEVEDFVSKVLKSVENTPELVLKSADTVIERIEKATDDVYDIIESIKVTKVKFEPQDYKDFTKSKHTLVKATDTVTEDTSMNHVVKALLDNFNKFTKKEKEVLSSLINYYQNYKTLTTKQTQLLVKFYNNMNHVTITKGK